ncbi:serine hydrolase [Paenibacillus filicis]|uniref:Serine hydrolase n=1 Tax=Paenibacillus gyeongsangnamensis TaxID=3388067 RepID=A0ABT4Q6T8_9BACL|nr:serine hydrolase [Paenibacillus filicis]MCZ8512511.1 serine hydrolase [Paenibacillus filicis]
MNPGMKRSVLLLCSLVLALSLAACAKQQAAPPSAAGQPSKQAPAFTDAAKPDYWPTAGWKTTSPEAQGMDSETLAEALQSYKDHNLHSVVVVRNGYLVAEAYSSGYQADTIQELHSATKSVTSSLVGMAVAEKKLKDLNQKVSDYFPEIASDPKKANMTVEHLLYMASGLDWNNNGEQSSLELMGSPDWMKYILSKPSRAEPGTVFHYSNGDAHLMSGIMQKATGQTLYDYAKPRLFEPLGITASDWKKDPQGYSIGAWSLMLTPRDMAKLGFLYMNHGVWDGRAVVPEQWIDASWEKRAPQKFNDGTQGGYGYYWWMKQLAPDTASAQWKQEVYFAAGSGGQRIFIVPGLKMIVAVTANNDNEAIMPEQLLFALAGSVKSDKALPESPEAAAKWTQAAEAFKQVKDKPE